MLLLMFKNIFLLGWSSCVFFCHSIIVLVPQGSCIHSLHDILHCTGSFHSQYLNWCPHISPVLFISWDTFSLPAKEIMYMKPAI